MCEHNKNQRAYCAYCRVNELEARITTLADDIAKAFTPFAFTCDCRGAHPDCASVIKDQQSYAQFDTVQRITKWLRDRAS